MESLYESDEITVVKNRRILTEETNAFSKEESSSAMKTCSDQGLPYVQKLGFRVARTERAAYSALEKKVGTVKAKECNEWFEKRAEHLGDGDIKAEIDFYSFKNSSLSLSLAISEMFDADYIRRACSWLADNKDCLGDKILDVGCDNGIITCFIAQICPEANVIGIDRCKESITSAKLLAEKFNLTNVDFINASLGEYPINDFDTVIALRISQENVKEPVVNAFNTFYNIAADFKDAFLHYSKSLISHLSEDGFLITGQMVEPNYYYFGQMLCLADMGWYPIDSDAFNYTSIESTMPLTFMISTRQNISEKESLNDFAEKLKIIRKEAGHLFMQPYYTSFSNFFLRSQLVEEIEKQKINVHDSIYYGWKANLLFEQKVGELILGYTIYYQNNDLPVMYSLWKNVEDSTAIIYFGASHIYSNGDMNKPNPCWANSDISQLEHISQGLLEFIINVAESGMIQKICTINVTDDGRIIETETSVEEVTQTAKNKKYHDLQKPGGLADFLRDSITNI